MRLALLTVLLLLAPAAQAAPPVLVGRVGDGPLRYLDEDLRVVPGSPRLGRIDEHALLSPDKRRIVTWYEGGNRFTIRNTATGKVIWRLPLHRAYSLVWPTRDHIIALQTRGKFGVRSFDLKRHRNRYTKLDGDSFQSFDTAGSRLIAITGSDDGQRAYVIGVAGAVKHRFGIPVEYGYDPRVNGDLILDASNTSTLFTLDGTPHPLDVPGASWLSHDLIAYIGGVARIDRASQTIVDTVDLEADSPLTAYRGGFIVGFGEQRYDASFNLVAARGETANTEIPIVAGDRLYAQRFTCDGTADDGIAIADARTGEPIDEVAGRWQLSRPDGGRVLYPDNGDSCD